MTKYDMMAKFNIYSIEDLISHYERKTNGHFFSKNTLQFFSSRISSNIYFDQYQNRILFITSEHNFNRTSRHYTVRSYSPSTGEIDSASSFLEYNSLSGAKRRALSELSRSMNNDTIKGLDAQK